MGASRAGMDSSPVFSSTCASRAHAGPCWKRCAIANSRPRVLARRFHGMAPTDGTLDDQQVASLSYAPGTMYIERLTLTNFRCFGPEPQSIMLTSELTALIGANGSGKTAVMQALLRMFGVSNDQRRVRRQDFHVPVEEVSPPTERTLVIEAVLAFPELSSTGATPPSAAAVPEFFNQMAVSEGGALKCRLRLDATWTDDGSIDGSIDTKFRAIKTLEASFDDSETMELTAIDRARIQIIYVPAMRDGASQVTTFLKGRLWRAVKWSDKIRETLDETGKKLNVTFSAEDAVREIANVLEKRWTEVHTVGTDAQPIFQPVDSQFEAFIQKVEVVFRPDESGRDRNLSDLSDGQRSLFHIAMTAATLDIEAKLAGAENAGFQSDSLVLPVLTILAVEEPENNLAPFYLSRIIRQLQELTKGPQAQAIVASHSASILARIDPMDIRYFRLDPVNRLTQVKEIPIQSSPEEDAKFIREAVRAYPELYFARFVVLGEGASEEVVLPLLADAMDVSIDRSFVAVIPLGGRHVNYFWPLLSALEIPYATLLDLDYGRDGGGWGRIKTAVEQLLVAGFETKDIFQNPNDGPDVFDKMPDDDRKGMQAWVQSLRGLGVFFCEPLDLDWAMLQAFPAAYKTPEPGTRGPYATSKKQKDVVLGEKGNGSLYDASFDELFSWYRYLFSNRSKPATHVRVLSQISPKDLAKDAPEALIALIGYIAKSLSISMPSSGQG